MTWSSLNDFRSKKNGKFEIFLSPDIFNVIILFISCFLLNFSEFPQFWSELEEDQDGLLEVKSVLTVLGYTTTKAVSQIKAKVLNDLESSYAKIRSSKRVEMLSRFPALEHVDYFTPGMKTIILELAAHFAPKLDPINIERIIKDKVLKQGQKVRLKHWLNIDWIFNGCFFLVLQRFERAEYYCGHNNSFHCL